MSNGYHALETVDNEECKDIGQKTDVQLIRRLLITQQQAHLHAVPGAKKTEHYSSCQSKGVPVMRKKTNKDGLYTTRPVDAGMTLLVPIGRELSRPLQKLVLPQLPLQNGR